MPRKTVTTEELTGQRREAEVRLGPGQPIGPSGAGNAVGLAARGA